jgi:hypothetical protein
MADYSCSKKKALWITLPKITTLTGFVPMETQRFASLLIISSIMVGARICEVLAFCSYKIVQLISMVIEATGLRFGIPLRDMLVHQSLREMSIVHSWIQVKGSPNHSLTTPKISWYSGNGRICVPVSKCKQRCTCCCCMSTGGRPCVV